MLNRALKYCTIMPKGEWKPTYLLVRFNSDALRPQKSQNILCSLGRGLSAASVFQAHQFAMKQIAHLEISPFSRRIQVQFSPEDGLKLVSFLSGVAYSILKRGGRVSPNTQYSDFSCKKYLIIISYQISNPDLNEEIPHF